MSTPRVSRAIGVCGVVLFVGVAAAQPQGRPGGGPGGPPEEFIDRVFARIDADGDGVISKAEAEGQPIERAFVEIDADGDGSVTRVEMAAWLEKRAAAERSGLVEDFDGGMRMAGRALRSLRRSALDDSTREDDLRAIAAIEAGLVGAKAHIGEVEMAPQAKEKYGDDRTAFETELRMGLLRVLGEAIELERAITEGRTDDAKAARDRLIEAQRAGHRAFQPEDDEDEGQEGGPRRGRGRPDR